MPKILILTAKKSLVLTDEQQQQVVEGVRQIKRFLEACEVLGFEASIVETQVAEVIEAGTLLIH